MRTHFYKIVASCCFACALGVFCPEGTFGQSPPNLPPPPTNLAPPPGANVEAESMGIIKSTLLYGADGDWAGSARGPAYRLVSRSQPGNIQYFWVQTKPETEGKRSFGVTVNHVKGGSAGLIYGFQENPNRYFLILVDADRTLHVYEKSEEGFQETLSSTTQGDAQVRLDVREDGNQIEILVDGNSMLSLGNDRIGRGGFGIAAMDSGEYVFSDFKFEVK